MPKTMRLFLVLIGLLTTQKAFADVVTHWPTTQPASVAVGQADAIYCPDMRSLLMALQQARRTSNTHIKLAPVEYHVTSELIVNGDGTTIDGNGATLVSTASFTGRIDPITNEQAQGTCIVIQPFLGRAVPFDKQTGGLWLNPSGTCVALNKEAGGTPQNFLEWAPCQDASGELMAKYAIFKPYIVPARNITIENLSIKFASNYSDGALIAKNAQNVVLRKLRVLNLPTDLGPGTGHGDLWADGSQWITFDSCEGQAGIQINSSLWCHVINCKAACSTYEEGARFCVTEKCTLDSVRTNDILCADIVFDSNTLLATNDNAGALWGGTRITFTNNTVHGGVWCGDINSRECIVKGNRGRMFADYSAKKTGNLIGPNP